MRLGGQSNEQPGPLLYRCSCRGALTEALIESVQLQAGENTSITLNGNVLELNDGSVFSASSVLYGTAASDDTEAASADNSQLLALGEVKFADAAATLAGYTGSLVIASGASMTFSEVVGSGGGAVGLAATLSTYAYESSTAFVLQNLSSLNTAEGEEDNGGTAVIERDTVLGEGNDGLIGTYQVSDGYSLTVENTSSISADASIALGTVAVLNVADSESGDDPALVIDFLTAAAGSVLTFVDEDFALKPEDQSAGIITVTNGGSFSAASGSEIRINSDALDFKLTADPDLSYTISSPVINALENAADKLYLQLISGEVGSVGGAAMKDLKGNDIELDSDEQAISVVDADNNKVADFIYGAGLITNDSGLWLGVTVTEMLIYQYLTFDAEGVEGCDEDNPYVIDIPIIESGDNDAGFTIAGPTPIEIANGENDISGTVKEEEGGKLIVGTSAALGGSEGTNHASEFIIDGTAEFKGTSKQTVGRAEVGDDGLLELGDGSLYVEKDFTLNSKLVIDGGSIEVTNDFNLGGSGSLDLGSGSHTVKNDFTVDGTLDLGTGSAWVGGEFILNDGAVLKLADEINLAEGEGIFTAGAGSTIHVGSNYADGTDVSDVSFM